MNVWQRWLKKPQTTILRKACFQVHLWLGLAIGLYIVMLSVTGSALVFRRELDRAFNPQRPPLDTTARILSEEELREAAVRAYPGYTVTRLGAIERRSPVLQIWLEQDGASIERLFNAYTGADLGDPFPRPARALIWVADLHDELLMIEGGRGRFWNGVGSVLVTLMCATGAVIWWRGIRNWRHGLAVRWTGAWPRFNFDLHSALGSWFFAILAIWAVSGIYLAFPGPFMDAVDWIWGPELAHAARGGDVALEWLVRLHFGRWRSHTLKAVWAVFGLVPVVMFVTGAAMWWYRVLGRSETSARARALVTLQREPQQ